MTENGIVCPLGCEERLEVYKRRNRTGYITRRRTCPTCGLRITTTERSVGGYSAEDLKKAQARLAERKRGVASNGTN